MNKKEFLLIYIICLLIKYVENNNDDEKIEWNGGLWAQNCMFEDDSFRSIEINGDECGKICDKNPECTHYHYSWNSGMCHLKKGPIAKNDAIRGDGSCGLSYFELKWKICGYESNSNIDSPSHVYSICGLSSIKWIDGEYAYACDYPSSDSITDKSNTTSSQCAVICDLDSQCTHYAWNSSNSGTCSLKKGTVSKHLAKYNQDSNIICGITKSYYKRDECYLDNIMSSNVCDLKKIKWNGLWAHNCEFIGNDIDTIESETSSECIKSCDRNLKCTHYNWNNGTCFLKDGPIKKSNARPISFSTTSICGLTYFNDKWSACGLTDGLNNEVYSICEINQVKWANNIGFACDMPGNDFLIVRDIKESSKCFTICSRLRNCTHFVWNEGTCHFKSGVFSKSWAKFIPNNLYSICGFPNIKDKLDYCLIQDETRLEEMSKNCDQILNRINWNVDWASGCDFDSKNDFHRLKASSGGECSAKCKETTGCSHYVWSPFLSSSGGICVLKKGLVDKEDARISANYQLNCGLADRIFLYEKCVIDMFTPSRVNYNSGRFLCTKMDLFLPNSNSRLSTCLAPTQDPCQSIYRNLIHKYYLYIYYLVKRLYRNYKILLSVVSMSGLITGGLFLVFVKVEELFHYFTNRFSVLFTRIFTPF